MRLFPVFLLLSAPALAYMGGITGVSGEFGGYCNGCHGGGSTPTVKLAGPTTLDAGEIGDYSLTITGGAAVVGGLDVAVDSIGAQLIAGPGTWTTSGELTHQGPVPFDAGTLIFTFQLRAPVNGGELTMYAAGNSCNGDGFTTGDQGNTDRMSIHVPVPPGFDAGPPVETPAASDGGDALLGPELMGCDVGGAAVFVPWAILCALALARRRPLQR